MIYVVRAFVQLREAPAPNKELAQRLQELERKFAVQIRPSKPPAPRKHPIGFIELEEKKQR